MNGRLLSETYLVLLLHEAGKHRDIRLPQYSTGIILGGILDLLEAGCVSILPDGRLKASAPLPAGYSGLAEIYRNIENLSKTTENWLDYYCCSPTLKRVSGVLDRLYDSLAEKHVLDVEVRKGIFREKRFISLSQEKAVLLKEEFLKNTEKNPLEENTVFCIQMLELAGLLKKYLSRGQENGRKSLLEQCRRTEIWKDMELYVNKIKNFNFQNTVNSGAMYQ